MNVLIFTLFCTEIPVNSVDPDQMPHSAASELSLHCLHMSPTQVSSLKQVTVKTLNIGTPRPATVVVLNIKQFNFTMK